jgi:hypothetical protein
MGVFRRATVLAGGGETFVELPFDLVDGSLHPIVPVEMSIVNVFHFVKPKRQFVASTALVRGSDQ